MPSSHPTDIALWIAFLSRESALASIGDSDGCSPREASHYSSLWDINFDPICQPPSNHSGPQRKESGIRCVDNDTTHGDLVSHCTTKININVSAAQVLPIAIDIAHTAIETTIRPTTANGPSGLCFAMTCLDSRIAETADSIIVLAVGVLSTRGLL
jgi:hypothetical protein